MELTLGTKPSTPCVECKGRRKRADARRTWKKVYGPLPWYTQVLHRCDNKRCENLDHLFTGTNKDNMTDCSIKERINRGEDRALHRLTEDLVREIRKDHTKSSRVWARELKVNHRTILMVRNGVTWKHVK